MHLVRAFVTRNFLTRSKDGVPKTYQNKGSISADIYIYTYLFKPIGGEDQAVKLSFSAAGIGGVRSQWEAVLWQNRLYVMVTQVDNQSTRYKDKRGTRGTRGTREYADNQNWYEVLVPTKLVSDMDKNKHSYFEKADPIGTGSKKRRKGVG